MDLGAYLQITDLEEIAKRNGIEIPRIRGYRIMADEKLVSVEKINEIKKQCEIEVARHLCESYPFWSINPYGYETNYYLNSYFLIENKDGKYTGIRWDRIHGWKRRVLKFEIKKKKKQIQNQYDLWNKYAGKEGVLYIHSRMGGDRWKYFEGKTKVMNQPWFLDRVDDWWDLTYCDFYAKIK